MKVKESYYIGIEIGGTKLQVVLGDSHGRIFERYRTVVDRSRGASGIRENMKGPLEEYVRKFHPEAIGIGFGGPVDYRQGKIAVSHHIEGWDDFDLVSWVRDLAGIPCYIENDANTAALGEAYLGSGRGFRKVFYVTLGSGVGGGMIDEGKIYHGAVPGESEIGLMDYNRTGRNIESQCSGWAMDARIRKYVADNPESPLAELVRNEPGAEARFLPEAIHRGDQGAGQLLDDSTDILAWGLSHVVHLFHPEIIILGGGLSLMGDILKDRVAAHLSRYLTRVFQPGPEVKIASLGEDVVIVGALLLAKKKNTF